MRTPTRTLSAVAAAALGFAALTGCSAGAAPSSQSVADGCLVVADGIGELESEMAGMSADLQAGDLSSVGTVMSSMRDALAELQPQVTNAEVRDVVDDMHGALTTFTASLGSAETLADLSTDESFAAAGEQMSTAGEQFSELCGG